MRVAILLIPITLISGCSGINNKPELQPVRVVEINNKKPKLNLPPVTPIKTLPLNWKIITEDNVSEIFSQLSEDEKSMVFYGLDQTNYENMSINMANILRLLQEQKSHIEAYRNYYENN